VGARDAENWWLRAQKESCDLKKVCNVTALLHGAFTGSCVCYGTFFGPVNFLNFRLTKISQRINQLQYLLSY
jgi:hypothetical protein